MCERSFTYLIYSEYTEVGGDEELPLGKEFQDLVKCFLGKNKECKPAAKLIEQL